ARRMDYLADVLDVLEELGPRLRRGRLVLLDPIEGGRGSGLEVGLVGAEDLRLQPQRRGGEDLANRRVAEEGVPEVLNRSALQQCRLAGQVAGLLEDVRFRCR